MINSNKNDNHICITILQLISTMLIFLISGCSFPQYIWPQKDFHSQELNQPYLEKKILIASRQSEYKEIILQGIKEYYKGTDVYIKVVGIEQLLDQNPDIYSAILLINTAMGWEIDRKVKRFISKYKNIDSIIVLTTSGGGDVLPDTDEYPQVDAISSASTKFDSASQHITKTIIDKINQLIKRRRQ